MTYTRTTTRTRTVARMSLWALVSAIALLVGTAAAAKASSGPSPGRPQLTADMPATQVQAYWDRYKTCLLAHGAGAPGPGPSPYTRALDACAALRPLPPAQLDPARNPHYTQDLAADVACLNDHGVPVVQIADGWTYRMPQTDRERRLSTLQAEPQRQAIERACQLQAFGATF